MPPRVQVAVQAPEWVQHWVPVDWFKRYERRIEESRLSIKKEEQEAFLEQVGRDGSQLLSMLYQEESPSLLAHLPQVQILRHLILTRFSEGTKDEDKILARRKSATFLELDP